MEHVRRWVWRDDLDALDLAERGGQFGGFCAVLRNTGQVLFHAELGRDGVRVELEEVSAMAALPDAGLFDEIGWAHEHGAGEGVEDLVKGDVDAVERGGDLCVRPTVEGGALPKTGAVQV